jgi:hypothetical protein
MLLLGLSLLYILQSLRESKIGGMGDFGYAEYWYWSIACMKSFMDDANPGIEVTVIYMYMNVCRSCDDCGRAIGFIMASSIILKIPLWILSTDIRGSKDRC